MQEDVHCSSRRPLQYNTHIPAQKTQCMRQSWQGASAGKLSQWPQRQRLSPVCYPLLPQRSRVHMRKPAGIAFCARAGVNESLAQGSCRRCCSRTCCCGCNCHCAWIWACSPRCRQCRCNGRVCLRRGVLPSPAGSWRLQAVLLLLPFLLPLLAWLLLLLLPLLCTAAVQR